jgi:predicted double-glycine peptidase
MRGAIAAIKNLRVFEKRTRFDTLDKSRLVDKIIIDPFDFSWSGVARGVRDRNNQPRIARRQRPQ